tara:strand:- start:214 stop:564 length:351 start_codon:yes stop_codon:yes gene_type:complete
MTPRTARFWVWHLDGWVRLALRDGDEVELRSGGPHEEGWTYTRETYAREGLWIRCRTENAWRDCDGPGGSESDSVCAVGLLQARKGCADLDVPGLLPMWEAGDSAITDVYAQREGY